jgi:hypothetical protein
MKLKTKEADLVISATDGRLWVGKRVLVHQSPGMSLTDEGLVEHPHDCNDPNQHWESRVVGWNKFQHLPMIATSAKKNPCHAEWTYTEESLTSLDGEDWSDKSTFQPGNEIKFKWEGKDSLHYPDGSILDARIEVAHIEPGDWYCSFVVKPNTPSEWRFMVVINEKEFLSVES